MKHLFKFRVLYDDLLVLLSFSKKQFQLWSCQNNSQWRQNCVFEVQPNPKMSRPQPQKWPRFLVLRRDPFSYAWTSSFSWKLVQHVWNFFVICGRNDKFTFWCLRQKHLWVSRNLQPQNRTQTSFSYWLKDEDFVFFIEPKDNSWNGTKKWKIVEFSVNSLCKTKQRMKRNSINKNKLSQSQIFVKWNH